MKLHFNKEVRISLAAEFKRAAWAGSAILGLGLLKSQAIAVVLAAVWWIFFQGLAHLVLAYADSS